MKSRFLCNGLLNWKLRFFYQTEEFHVRNNREGGNEVSPASDRHTGSTRREASILSKDEYIARLEAELKSLRGDSMNGSSNSRRLAFDVHASMREQTGKGAVRNAIEEKLRITW